MISGVNEEMGVSLDVLLEGLVRGSDLLKCKGIAVTGLSQDSRKAKRGDLFFAISGKSTHGLSHAVEAVKKGVVVVLWENNCENCDDIIRDLSSQVAFLKCQNLKMMIGQVADRFYGHPSSKLNMIGVTGTDGKTSISHFIAQSLDGVSKRCGVLGTLGNGFLDDLSITGLTTAPVIDVHQCLAEMLDQGAEHVVMEVSSHGLDQGRVDAISFDIAVFSNFSQDHLDYHGTLEAYGAAKKKLFSMPGLKVAVINLDDSFGRELAEECKSRLCVWGYSASNDISDLKQYADYMVHARKIEPIENGFQLTVKTPKGSGSLSIGLLGSFNITNALATLATVLVSGVSFEEAVKKLHLLRPVMGRMETINVKGKPTVVVDYAHTPNALDAACNAVNEHFHGSTWCVFGCGGDRDSSKRPLMARAAEKACDKIVLTSDNPRHEDPLEIIDQVMQGFKLKDVIKVIVDRKQAIEYAINNATKNDVVLLAGKGHECSQIIGDSHIAFSDKYVASECLGALS